MMKNIAGDYSCYTRGIEVLNLKHELLKEIPVVFHNSPNYDYHFMIKHLAEEFKGQFRFQRKIHTFFCFNKERN